MQHRWKPLPWLPLHKKCLLQCSSTRIRPITRNTLGLERTQLLSGPAMQACRPVSRPHNTHAVGYVAYAFSPKTQTGAWPGLTGFQGSWENISSLFRRKVCPQKNSEGTWCHLMASMHKQAHVPLNRHVRGYIHTCIHTYTNKQQLTFLIKTMYSTYFMPQDEKSDTYKRQHLGTIHNIQLYINSSCDILK